MRGRVRDSDRLCYEVSDRDGEQKMREAVQENAAFIKASSLRNDDMQKR